MLKEKMLWMKDSGNIGDEIRQCRDEGRQIEALLPRAEKIAAMEDGEEKEKQARELLLEMENCPVKAMFPYEEPEACEDIRKAAQGSSLCRPVPEEELENRLKGAWIGRASGCLLGIPVEGWSRSKIRGFLKESGQYPLRSYMHSETDAEIREKYGVKDRDPGTAYDRQKICWINNMDTYPVDDDMNYTVISLRVLERAGSGFTSEDVAESWLFGLPAFHTCTAERVAYRNLMHGVLPPESGRLANPFREWIGAQIRVDFYGYIAAGNPALAADMAYGDERREPDTQTVKSYLGMLKDLYLLTDLEGWEPPLRAKSRVRTKPKRYFVDPSLPAAVLGAAPNTLMRDTQTLGDLFETLCIRDLNVYLSAMPGANNRIAYYRDDKGLEVDVIIELSDGRWGAIEIKLSDLKVNDDNADKLKSFRDKICGNPMAQVREPEFMMFLTGRGGKAYRRNDGILVVPIATFGA